MVQSPNRKDLNRDKSDHGGISVTLTEAAWNTIEKEAKLSINEETRREIQNIIDLYSYDKTFYIESPSRKEIDNELATCLKSTEIIYNFFGINLDALSIPRSQMVNEIKENISDHPQDFINFYRYLSEIKVAINKVRARLEKDGAHDKGGIHKDLSEDRLLIALEGVYTNSGGDIEKNKSNFILSICKNIPDEINPKFPDSHDSLSKSLKRAKENLS